MQYVAKQLLFTRSRLTALHQGKCNSTSSVFASVQMLPLKLSFCILRKSIKMNAGTFIETITASNCTTSLAILLLLTLKMADNTNYVTSLRLLHNLYQSGHAEDALGSKRTKKLKAYNMHTSDSTNRSFNRDTVYMKDMKAVATA